jgi:hypothetical protein
VAALPEHPAVSARLMANKESRTHDEHWRAACLFIPFPLHQAAGDIVVVLYSA